MAETCRDNLIYALLATVARGISQPRFQLAARRQRQFQCTRGALESVEMQRDCARCRHAVAVRDDAHGLEDAVAALERDVPDATFQRRRGRRHAVQGCEGAAVSTEAAERPECHLSRYALSISWK